MNKEFFEEYWNKNKISYDVKALEIAFKDVAKKAFYAGINLQFISKILTDDEIKDLIDSIDFKSMVTADDIFYLIARKTEEFILGNNKN